MHVLTSDSRILLTGATGLIGGEILRALMRLDVETVWALVRQRVGINVEGRLLHRLERSGDLEFHALPPIVKAVAGDVSENNLGLSEQTYHDIINNTNIVIHCAAETSFVRVDACRSTNICSVRHIIELARHCDVCPLIVYVSTASNSGEVRHCSLSEDDGCNLDNHHFNEYTRSKALAEHLLRESGLPYLVVRPSIVLSSCIPDAGFARSILWMTPLLNEFDALPIDHTSRLDLVPVHFVVESLIALLKEPNREYQCYHLSAGHEQAVTCAQMSAFIDGYYSRKKPLRLIPPKDWGLTQHRRYIRTDYKRKLLSRLKLYLPFLNMDVVFDNRRLIEALGPEAVFVPDPRLYMGKLLDMISYEEAVAESENP